MLPMIRAVTIDFWNTIVEPGDGALRRAARVDAVMRAASDFGRDLMEVDAVRAIDSVYPIFEKIWFSEQRTLTPAECVAIVWDQLNMLMPAFLHERTVSVFERSILIDPPPLLPEAYAVIHELGRCCKLAVISDTSITPGAVLREILARYGLETAFTHFVFSDETGVAKPHERAFRSALAALGVDPQETVHVGDIERTDIIGAKNVGMKAILFRGKKNNSYQKDGASTQADAVAESWNEVLGIISAWNEEGMKLEG